MTSIADRRLATLRNRNPDGILLGGYGWVEDLRPGSGGFTSDGFIHAPSVPQAISAAVLRGGYQSHTGGAANPFAVNLSSSRTRLAGRLLDAVRAGQPPGAMTGYDFERNLQESGAGRYTRQFRECAPPSSTTYPPAGATGSAAAPASVAQAPSLTDGLVLRDKWLAGDQQVAALLAQIASDDQQGAANGQPALLPAVNAALGALGDALDAAADALTAESLHHAINGVPSRAAATLNALARGDGAVPELDLLTGPRTGLTIGHRAGFAVAASAGPRPGWAAPAPGQLRAAANPTLEAIVQGWLPDPRRVRCAATFTPEGGQPQTTTIYLSDCDIGALDCVYETPVVPPPDGAVPGLLSLAVTEAARTSLGVTASQALTLTWTRTADFAAAELTFGELCGVCRLARALLQDSTALRPAHLGPIGTPDAPVADAALTARADAAETAVRGCASGLAAGDPRTAIRTAASLGVRGAAYAASVAQPDPSLVASIAAAVRDRVAQLDALTSSAAAARDVQRLQAAFGADFLPIPAFLPANASDLSAAASAAQTAGWADAPAIRGWLGRNARVRPRLAGLVRLRTAAQRGRGRATAGSPPCNCRLSPARHGSAASSAARSRADPASRSPWPAARCPIRRPRSPGSSSTTGRRQSRTRPRSPAWPTTTSRRYRSHPRPCCSPSPPTSPSPAGRRKRSSRRSPRRSRWPSCASSTRTRSARPASCSPPSTSPTTWRAETVSTDVMNQPPAAST